MLKTRKETTRKDQERDGSSKTAPKHNPSHGVDFINDEAEEISDEDQEDEEMEEPSEVDLSDFERSWDDDDDVSWDEDKLSLVMQKKYFR